MRSSRTKRGATVSAWERARLRAGWSWTRRSRVRRTTAALGTAMTGHHRVAGRPACSGPGPPYAEMSARRTPPPPRGAPTLPTVPAFAQPAPGGPGWLAQQRRRAADGFAASALPTDHEEIWRYSRIGDLDLGDFTPVAPAPAGPDRVPAGIEAVMAAAAGPGTAVVLSAGGAPPRTLTPAPPGIDVEQPGDQPWPLGHIAGDTDAFSLLNTAQAPHPVRVRVTRRAPADAAVVVVNWLEDDGAAHFPRLLVEVEADARASVLEVTASPDVASLVVPLTELAVGPGARLRYTNVQLLGP